jgi:hypothetical protein
MLLLLLLGILGFRVGAGWKRRVGLMEWGGHDETFGYVKWYWALLGVVTG